MSTTRTFKGKLVDGLRAPHVGVQVEAALTIPGVDDGAWVTVKKLYATTDSEGVFTFAAMECNDAMGNGSQWQLVARIGLERLLDNVRVTLVAGAGDAWLHELATTPLDPLPPDTDDVPEGEDNLYFTAARVRAVLLDGYQAVAAAVIGAGDSILGALQKLQAQASALAEALTAHAGLTNNPHGVTKAQVGLGNANNTSDEDKPVSTAQAAADTAVFNAAAAAVAARIGNSLQGYDADLAAIAALAPSNDDFLQRKGDVWSSRTPAQAQVDLGIAGGLTTADLLESFGDGSDGTVTISSGTTTLPRDMFYDTLTINGTGQLAVNGFRIFCRTELDLSSAPANAIIVSATSSAGGSGGATGSSGSGGSAVTSGSIAGRAAGGAGAAGGTGAGGTSSGNNGNNGGGFGNAGAGGAGSGGAGGNAGAAGGVPSPLPVRRSVTELMRGAALISGGAGGRGGASGGGNGTNNGGGGGGGGAGGGVLAIFARKITRGASTAAGCIQVNGGDGGNGGTPSGSNCGGGGGANGGGGGWVYIVYGELAGSPGVNAIYVDGGRGGDGGAGNGTGFAGGGSSGSTAGRVTLICLPGNAATETVGNVTNGPGGQGSGGGAGGAGGIGGAGGQHRVNL